jgi:hypothetical protein
MDWNYLFLDHDLGGKDFVDSNEEETGYQVAKFILEKGIKYEVCIIHSMNYAGAENMFRVLPKSRHIPFHMIVAGNKNV